jgi:hypothetical protein
MLDLVDAVLAVLEPLGESWEESGGDAIARAGEVKSLSLGFTSRDAGVEVIKSGHLRHRGYLRVPQKRDRGQKVDGTKRNYSELAPSLRCSARQVDICCS